MGLHTCCHAGREHPWTFSAAKLETMLTHSVAVTLSPMAAAQPAFHIERTLSMSNMDHRSNLWPCPHLCRDLADVRHQQPGPSEELCWEVWMRTFAFLL